MTRTPGPVIRSPGCGRRPQRRTACVLNRKNFAQRRATHTERRRALLDYLRVELVQGVREWRRRMQRMTPDGTGSL